MVKSKKIYSPQTFVEAVTGLYYAFRGEDDVIFIEEKLALNGFELWNYPLSEIAHIVENNLNVVLVDCAIWSEITEEFEHEYRWFEVPEDFEEVEI